MGISVFDLGSERLMAVNAPYKIYQYGEQIGVCIFTAESVDSINQHIDSGDYYAAIPKEEEETEND